MAAVSVSYRYYPISSYYPAREYLLFSRSMFQYRERSYVHAEYHCDVHDYVTHTSERRPSSYGLIASSLFHWERPARRCVLRDPYCLRSTLYEDRLWTSSSVIRSVIISSRQRSCRWFTVSFIFEKILDLSSSNNDGRISAPPPSIYVFSLTKKYDKSVSINEHLANCTISAR